MDDVTDAEQAFLMGVYEGVMSDMNSEGELSRRTDQEALLTRYEKLQSGDWDFPEGDELLTGDA